MKHTLVTFLGRSRYDKDTGYRKARYQFPDARQPVETAFFGLALAAHLKVDNIVILGTSGSQWSVLVESLAKNDEQQSTRDDLFLAESEEQVTQAMLEGAAPIMREAIGKHVIPHLIPYGSDGEEQYHILNAIAVTVPDGSVSFDLTHGFRHLGMVGFLSAFMLERIRKLNVCGLWYGALDMTRNGITPVLQLDGLTRVRRWVEALNRFDATGDYGVFAPLLIEDEVVSNDKIMCLEKAAFHERNLNLSGAKEQLQTFRKAAAKEPWPSASGLFQKRLLKRLRWAEKPGLDQNQKDLALEYLGRGDFLRAAALGWEALATSQCLNLKCSADDFESRKHAIDHFRENEVRHENTETAEAFRTLQNVRNTLVHGNPPSEKYRRILRKPDRLREELEKAFQCLL